MIHCFLDIVPPTVTAQQKGAYARGGKVHFYTKRQLKDLETLYGIHLARSRPQLPIEGPVHLVIRYTFPLRSGERAGYKRQGFRLHDVRPDLDNLEKLLIDTMTKARWFRDDSQISVKITTKFWGLKPGIEIIAQPAAAHWLDQHTDLPPLSTRYQATT
jgi:Holliday junction resolvase RusA-like endonuclease